MWRDSALAEEIATRLLGRAAERPSSRAYGHVPPVAVTFTENVTAKDPTFTDPLYVPVWVMFTRASAEPVLSSPPVKVAGPNPGPLMTPEYVAPARGGFVAIARHTCDSVGETLYVAVTGLSGEHMSSDRRDFLRQLTIATAAVGGGAIARPLEAEDVEHAAQTLAASSAAWDMSWVEQVQRAQYKAVFDSPALADGSALDLAAGIQNDFKEVYGSDDVVRMVIIMRQLGQVMAFNDDLWDRYAIGEERKVNDPVTKQPARRNPWAKPQPGEPDWERAAKLDTLRARGAIFLVCNRASMNWARSASERTKKDLEQVQNDVRNGLVPGATLMPTGVFALVRAQNAGCAYMKGS